LAAHRDNIQGGDTLDKRFDAIEASIESIDTASLDARLDKIDGGSALIGDTTLAARVTATETAIGDANSGLTQSVANLTTTVAGKANNADVITLQTTVGNN